MFKKVVKLVGAGGLAFMLFFTSATASAAVEPRSILLEPIETVELAPKTQITVEYYSQMRWTGSAYGLESRSMTKSHGQWADGPNYSSNASTGKVFFNGTVQLVSLKDVVNETHTHRAY